MATSSGSAAELEIAGIHLTHPDRVLYPEQGISKRRLAEYYRLVADAMLPHLVGRPLTLVRCPRGQGEACFYQRHLNGEVLQGVEQVKISDPAGKSAAYAVIRDLSGLIELAQLGVLEIHAWGALAADPDRPDRLVFDLDPGEGAIWEDVIHGVRWLHRRLATLGLQSFLRTTGGKGLHVVAPILPEHDWETVKNFARNIAEQLVSEQPGRYVATASKAERVGKVYVDYLRNARGASSIVNYPRARPRAPIAFPMVWADLNNLDRSDGFTIEDSTGYLSFTDQEPWEGFFELRQNLSQALEKSPPTPRESRL